MPITEVVETWYRWAVSISKVPGKRPLMIGVAGGSGSGKTTVARRLAATLEGRCAMVEYDSYYRDRSDLSFEEREVINFDHPDSLESELLVEHLGELRGGFPVEQPVYDFVRHLRSEQTLTIAVAPVVIIEGIMTLVDAHLRDMLDIKIYVDTDSDIRVLRRIRRDLEQRGRTFASVRDRYYKHVRPMHLQFVEPSKRWADLIIPEGGDNQVALEVLAAKLEKVADAQGLDITSST